MSLAWITRVLASPEPAAARERLLLIALADMANDEGCCWPSLETLGRRCAVDPRTVRRNLSALEAGGFIRREFRSGHSTVYWLQEPAGADASIRTDTADRGSVAHPTPDAPVRPVRTPLSSRTVHEPSLNPAAAEPIDESVRGDSDELVGLLVKRGVHGPVAERLVREHDAAYIRRHVEHYDALCARKGVRRGPGWIVASIQDDYVIPEVAPEPSRLFTYQEALVWLERSGIRLSVTNPFTRWFEPVRQPDGKVLFKRSAISGQGSGEKRSAVSHQLSAVSRQLPEQKSAAAGGQAPVSQTGGLPASVLLHEQQITRYEDR